ncbi:MAG: YncE family protein, partial [bacterium]
MGPQYSYRGFMLSLMALVAFALTAALSSAPNTSRPHSSAKASSNYTLFESGQVRPLAMSPDKRHLFAVNTPDNRLEIFRIRDSGLIHTASIPVGLEPVAVAARSNHEVWVVNHFSDSVSVVELDAHGDDLTGQVERTLLVGDEPRDIVFAGPGRKRAFITTAHRGQNIPFDPQLSTPGVGRADVWVFDADELGDGTLGGKALSIVTLFTDTPRALAVTPDGSRVYAAGFHTGNQTSSIAETSIPDGFGADGVAGPATNA